MKHEGPAPAPRGEDSRVWCWLQALERRHLATLSFAEVRRALTALSALYVEKRGERLGRGEPLASAGKRAAFGLFYTAVHFAVVREIVRALGAGLPAPASIVDLGCGTGVAGAAWAVEAGRRSQIEGQDRSGWALAEARWNWSQLGVSGATLRLNLAQARWARRSPGIVVAYTLNELDEELRRALLERLMEAASEGSRLLIVEPLSRRVVPWWESWAERFLQRGGRDDEWRFAWRTTATLALLDRAAGLDHRQLGARSLWL